jgi:hypothetical protein
LPISRDNRNGAARADEKEVHPFGLKNESAAVGNPGDSAATQPLPSSTLIIRLEFY